MIKLVLLRHGESIWNKENRFTGWVDVDLSAGGIAEAKKAALILKKKGYSFDIAYTSVLKRAVRTLWILLEKMKLHLPVDYSWRLNERHYGALQGMDKGEMVKKFGEGKVKAWRRSYAVRPPAVSQKEWKKQKKEARYAELGEKELPASECLKDVFARVLPYWKEEIAPAIKGGKRVLICAHGNSIRALVKYLDGISDEEIVNVNIPTGMPLVYELDGNLKPIRHYYLGNAAEIKKAIEKVKNQVGVKKK
ncbi:phosphoglyceromutase [Candidatus Micrarchaeota archaeon CG1_02_47_40]|nr:MAG: phosphoglyceromutase [Candidatus Micrarchaeota archaeon CG1_02_47_40]